MLEKLTFKEASQIGMAIMENNMDYTQLTDRELDALIAEKVMGWRRTTHWSGSTPISCLVHPTDGSVLPDDFPHYSTNIGAAWQVIALCQSYKVGNPSNEGNTFASLQIKGRSAFMLAPTAPRAICLAALTVMEEE